LLKGFHRTVPSRALYPASAAEERAGPAKVDVGALEEELAELRGVLDGELRERQEAIESAEAVATNAARAANEELLAAKAEVAAEATEGATLQTQFEATVGTHIEAMRLLNYYQDRKEKLVAHIASHGELIEQHQQVVVARTADAEVVCKRETAEGYLPDGEAEVALTVLHARHDKAKKMVLKESQRHERTQEVVLKVLKEIRKKYNRLKQTLSNARKPCDTLKKGVKLRQRLLKQTSKDVQKEVSHRFNYYLAKKGHAGKVDVDYNAATLTLDVKMHGQGQTVKDTRSMSGGERSYSTLALTLSLGESIESPFRAMDEFDVFMDAVNRKVSMDALIDFARDPFNKDKQFLFITPQDISAVDASAPDIKVQKMKAARPS